MGEASPLPVADKTFIAFIGVASASAVGFLAYLLLGHPAAGASIDVSGLPAVNASLNGASAMFLIAGYVAIRRGERRIHKFCMVSAFTASALFLCCYIAYHAVHGDTKFQGQGWIRPVYFAVLISHILLSVVVLPMALTTLFFAARRTFTRHRRLARWTLPLWLYVSITGVAIFFMLSNPMFNGSR